MQERRPERGAGRKVETCFTRALLLITRKAVLQKGLWGSKERPCKSRMCVLLCLGSLRRHCREGEGLREKSSHLSAGKMK